MHTDVPRIAPTPTTDAVCGVSYVFAPALLAAAFVKIHPNWLAASRPQFTLESSS
jgi:hypothetical protein